MKYQRNKSKKSIKFINILATVFIVIILCTIFANPIKAKENSMKSETINFSELFMDLINSNISSLEAFAYDDGEKHLSGIFEINPLNIVTNEIGFLQNSTVKQVIKEQNIEEHSKLVEQIVINPFKLDEKDIKKQDEVANMVGNPADNSKKKVLIYHTHTTEAYSSETRKTDNTQNMAAVGDELTKELEKYGFTVVHDKTIHDVDYNRAYYKSRETLNKYLNSYGDFDLIIDMHRDAGPEKKHVTAKINEENVARMMLVTTEQDPRYKAHMNNINSIFGIAKKTYPEIFRERNIQINQSGIKCYNQDLSDNAILLEVGASSNTLQEAKNTMKYIARVFAEHLNGK